MLEPQKVKGHLFISWKEFFPKWIPLEQPGLLSQVNCLCYTDALVATSQVWINIRQSFINKIRDDSLVIHQLVLDKSVSTAQTTKLLSKVFFHFPIRLIKFFLRTVIFPIRK